MNNASSETPQRLREHDSADGMLRLLQFSSDVAATRSESPTDTILLGSDYTAQLLVVADAY